MKGISRIDSPRCHGWFVRIYREGQAIGKLYSDLKYGGKRKAHDLAVRYLNKLNRENPTKVKSYELVPPFKISGKRAPENKSGMNGVSLMHEKKIGRKKILTGYSVSYRLGGKSRNKRFTLTMFGSKSVALAKAKAFRKKAEKLMLKEWKTNLKKKGIDVNKLMKKYG